MKKNEPIKNVPSANDSIERSDLSEEMQWLINTVTTKLNPKHIEVMTASEIQNTAVENLSPMMRQMAVSQGVIDPNKPT